MPDLQLESGIQALEERLQKREYFECIELGNYLLAEIRAKAADHASSIHVKTACIIAIGDANFGLKQFQEALFQYECARKLTEEKYGPLTEESMRALFRVERALRALAMLQGGGDTRNIHTSTLLLASQAGQDGELRRTGRHARTLHQLKGLWSETIDKQKNKGKNPIVALVETVLQKLGSSRLEEFLSRISIIVSMTGLFCMFVYAFFWWQTHPDPTAIHPVPHGDFHAVNLAHCKNKSMKWAFKTVDGANNLAWSQDGTVDLSGDDLESREKLPVIIYDGSPSSLFNSIFAAWTRNNLLLRWNGYAMQDEYDSTYYDASEPETAVAGKMYALGNWAQDYFKRGGKYPAAGDKVQHGELAYSNPLSKKTDKAYLINAKENAGAPPAVCTAQGIPVHPGSIVCAAIGPRKFLIAAFDRARNPIPVSNAANGFLQVNPGQKSLIPPMIQEINNAQGIIVFDKPIDQISDFLCAHTTLAGTSLVLLLGVICPALFLMTRNWKNAVRTVTTRGPAPGAKPKR